MTKRTAATEKGQSLVELALTITLILFILLGVVDFGFGFLYWISIRDAAQEGATYGSLHPGTACNGTLRNWVRNASTSPLISFNTTNLPDSQIVVTNTGYNPGDSITVRVTYNYNVLSPFPGLPTSIPIGTSVSDTILQVDLSCP